MRPRHPAIFPLASLLFLAGALPLAAQDVKIFSPLTIGGDLSLSVPESSLVFPDGSRQPSAGVAYADITVVSPVGTAVQNGAALLAALGAVTDATRDTPHLVKIEPGTYELGSQALHMKPYVDIEGSGRAMTRLKGSLDSDQAGVVVGSDNAELRWLSVESTGPGVSCAAIFNKGCAPRIFQVTALASGCSSNFAIQNIASATPEILHVSAVASGAHTFNYAVANIFCQPSLYAVSAEASGGDYNYGVYNNFSQANLARVKVRATGGKRNFAILCNQDSPALTLIDAGSSGGSIGNYGFYITNCSPDIRQARVEVSSGPENYGVLMSACASALSSLWVTVTGVGDNRGIHMEGSSAASFHDVVVSVEGGATNYAFYNIASMPRLASVAASAAGANSYGFYSLSGGTGQPEATTSLFKGGTKAVRNDGPALDLAACKLEGGFSGAANCLSCYSGGYFPLDSSCN